MGPYTGLPQIPVSGPNAGDSVRNFVTFLNDVAVVVAKPPA